MIPASMPTSFITRSGLFAAAWKARWTAAYHSFASPQTPCSMAIDFSRSARGSMPRKTWWPKPGTRRLAARRSATSAVAWASISWPEARQAATPSAMKRPVSSGETANSPAPSMAADRPAVILGLTETMARAATVPDFCKA
jgi:hypothetical protein